MSHLIILAIIHTTLIAGEAIPVGEGWDLVWSDEFNGNQLDESKWFSRTQTGWQTGNNEAQHYVDHSENAFLRNGKLVIKAIDTDFNNHDYTSAKLQSKVDWKYGWFKVRAKLPRGFGTWPAIWMLPRNGLRWPAGGEIDIMEHVGYDENNIHSAIHTASFNHRLDTQLTAHTDIPDVTSEFHEYSVLWTKNLIKFWVDDVCTVSLSKLDSYTSAEWPFNDRPFYLILNLAIGGEWGGSRGIDRSIFPAEFEIDWVRIYKNGNANSLQTMPCYEPQNNCDVEWSRNKGRWQHPENFDGFQTVTGANLRSASVTDFRVWFYCTKPQCEIDLPIGRFCGGQDCAASVQFAKNTGRWQHPEWYGGFEEVTGTPLLLADTDDMTVYFYCTPALKENCPGLMLPTGRTCYPLNEPADVSCEKCPEGRCHRGADGTCVVFNDGYHCTLGDVGVQCNYGSACFDWNGQQLYTWNQGAADLNVDTCHQVDRSCEKCPEGACDRNSDGNCVVYSTGYHCKLGDVGTQCDYGRDCFRWAGEEFFKWKAGSASLDSDQCYGSAPSTTTSTTTSSTTSTTTNSPQQVCGGPIRSAMNHGRHSNPEWYDGFERITGSELSEATIEDFTVWFFCTPAKRRDCPGLTLPEGRECNPATTTMPTTSTTTDSPQLVCGGPIRWAMNSGRYSNPEWYDGFERITGAELSEATIEDFTVWFYCTPAKMQNCPGLLLPQGRQCNEATSTTTAPTNSPTTTTMPPTSTSTTTSTTTVSRDLVCGGSIRWATNTGRHSNPEWYEDFETITGAELAEAAIEDFTVWFFCTPAKRQGCPGLTLPEGRVCNPGPVYDEPNADKVALMRQLLSGRMSQMSFNRVGNSANFILRQERQGDELNPDVRSAMRRIRWAKQQGYSQRNWNIMRRRFNLLNL